MPECADIDSLVYVNGLPTPWRPGLTVADLVAARATVTAEAAPGAEPGAAPIDGPAPPGPSFATALNGHFVARTRRGDTPVQPGDALTLFEAIVGG